MTSFLVTRTYIRYLIRYTLQFKCYITIITLPISVGVSLCFTIYLKIREYIFTLLHNSISFIQSFTHTVHNRAPRCCSCSPPPSLSSNPGRWVFNVINFGCMPTGHIPTFPFGDDQPAYIRGKTIPYYLPYTAAVIKLILNDVYCDL